MNADTLAMQTNIGDLPISLEDLARTATRTVQRAGIKVQRARGAHCVLMIKTLAIHRPERCEPGGTLPEDWPLIERARRIDE